MRHPWRAARRAAPAVVATGLALAAVRRSRCGRRAAQAFAPPFAGAAARAAWDPCRGAAANGLVPGGPRGVSSATGARPSSARLPSAPAAVLAVATAAALLRGAGAARRAQSAARRGLSTRRVATVDAPASEASAEFKYKIELDDLVSLCKRRGFIFQSSEIYGGYAGFFDYGPLGVELKNNLKKMWWRRMVHGRDDVVGLDSAIITNPRTHQASGHVDNFSDPMVDCTESKKRFRADQLMWARVTLEDGTDVGCVSALQTGDVDEVLKKKAQKLMKDRGVEGTLRPFDIKDMTEATTEECALIPNPDTNKVGCLTPARAFNLMFETNVGPYSTGEAKSYLRPETAQGIFVNFKNVADVSRLKVPFGVAQIGKAFRNEITPRQFLFRSREFEQMEIEYFIDPEADFAAEQEAWITEMWNFLKAMGLDERLMDREVHEGDKLAHYARACTDIVFRYPFGQQELLGVAARGEYDLQQHIQASGKTMDYQVPPPAKKRRYVPHVIEPSLGVDRLFLALMCSAYDEDEVGGEKRSFLRFPACVAPITLGIMPLMKKPPALTEKAKELAAMLRRKGYNVLYDDAGSIGKRYRRMDEVGTPFCVCVDFDTLDDGAAPGTVTIRDRDEPLKVFPRLSFDEVRQFLDEKCELQM